MLLLNTFGLCLLSAVLPLVNAEAYLGGLGAVHGGARIVPLACAAAAGQTCGKVLFFLLGRRSLDWAWVRRKTSSEKWQARLALWRARIHGRPVLAGGAVFASGLLGFPPLAVLSVVAGQLDMRLAVFVVATFVGRALRFAALLGGAAALFH